MKISKRLFENDISTKMKRPLVIVVDGVIGAGKTTYVNMIADMLIRRGKVVTLVHEPVSKWLEKPEGGGLSLFELFNLDKKRWSYHFQTKAFHDRVMENRKMFEQYGDITDIFILERSCFTDRIFMQVLYEEGYVYDVEMKDYKEWSDLWELVMPYHPDLFIYLRPPVDVCMERILERNRLAEDTISISYQQKLQQKHDEFFSSGKVQIKEGHFVPCVTVETVEDYRTGNEHIRQKMVEEFQKFTKLFESV